MECIIDSEKMRQSKIDNVGMVLKVSGVKPQVYNYKRTVTSKHLHQVTILQRMSHLALGDNFGRSHCVTARMLGSII